MAIASSPILNATPVRMAVAWSAGREALTPAARWQETEQCGDRDHKCCQRLEKGTQAQGRPSGESESARTFLMRDEREKQVERQQELIPDHRPHEAGRIGRPHRDEGEDQGNKSDVPCA